jgi:2-keto-4-pentenoate hydratase/2-oxohepta-3-ene-1,7-dioic acid hydratase in catechol pathway
MKFLRVGAEGAEKPAVLAADGSWRDLSGHIADIDPVTIGRLPELKSIDPMTLPELAQGTRIGSCVGRPGKILCVGLNYADHAAETGAPIPAEPILFMKAVTSLCGPNDDVFIPPASEKTDWEVELGVVIGRTARHVTEAEAMDHVAGFCVVNDVSERHYQIERGGTWDKGKGYDRFAPVGPWLVTPDEVPNPHDLAMWLEVDGHRYQNGSTRTMIFGVPTLVSYISQFMTLSAGDIICTGTPPGVGLGQKPPVYLHPGQTIRLGIEGLGEQSQITVASPYGR